jgi:ubiquitin-protein ligase
LRIGDGLKLINQFLETEPEYKADLTPEIFKSNVRKFIDFQKLWDRSGSEGFYVSSNNIEEGFYLSVFPPDKCVYEGGLYKFKISLEGYPSKPPKSRIVTSIFHPSVYTNQQMA